VLTTRGLRPLVDVRASWRGMESRYMWLSRRSTRVQWVIACMGSACRGKGVRGAEGGPRRAGGVLVVCSELSCGTQGQCTWTALSLAGDARLALATVDARAVGSPGRSVPGLRRRYRLLGPALCRPAVRAVEWS